MKSQHKTIVSYVLQAVVSIGIIFYALNLWKYNIKVPFNYWGDTIYQLLAIKSIIQNGWTFDIPQLSAPYSLSLVSFPVNASSDWLIIKFLSLFTHEPGLILNIFWILTFVLTGWTTMFAMEQLKISKSLAFVGGIVYAFLPYAVERNVGHLNLVYYLIPLVSLFVVKISNIQDEKQGPINKKTLLAGCAGCFFQGFNYIYYSFFSVGLLIYACLLNQCKKISVKYSAVAIAILITTTVANLVPSIYSWNVGGKPPDLGYKQTAEAEIYGAKIRKMLAPSPLNPLPLLSNWGKKDAEAGFPHENENTSVRQGIYCAIGFILLICVSIGVLKTESNLIRTLAYLNITTLLVITVGGVGVIFNLFVLPDIRCYNRFSIFISFFSLVAISKFIDDLLNKTARKFQIYLIGIVVCLALFSLYDQTTSFAYLLNRQDGDTTAAHEERDIVTTIEKNCPKVKNVFQFPTIGFPIMEKYNRMESYDHLRPYIWSTSLNWSSPSFSSRHLLWQEKINKLNGKELLDYLAYSNFDLVWVDRYAYKDNADAIVSDLLASGAKKIHCVKSDRFALFDLSDYKSKIMTEGGAEQFKKIQTDILSSAVIIWGKGFYAEEKISGSSGAVLTNTFRWANNTCEIKIINDSDYKNILLEFEVASAHEGIIVLRSNNINIELKTGARPTKYSLNLKNSNNKIQTLHFTTQLKRVESFPDPRELYFRIINPALKAF
jgi:phosphoglycerol transferase